MRFALRFGKSYRPTCRRWASSASVVRLRPLMRWGWPLSFLCCCCEPALRGRKPPKAQAAWGMAVGLPQMVALTVEGPDLLASARARPRRGHSRPWAGVSGCA